jgi:hypothetical protein
MERRRLSWNVGQVPGRRVIMSFQPRAQTRVDTGATIPRSTEESGEGSRRHRQGLEPVCRLQISTSMLKWLI